MHQLPIRVRYIECDPMGLVHHANYPVWFEMGRTELLRDQSGLRYRDLEEQGILLAVVSLELKYKRPARYDDELVLHTHLEEIGHVKITHRYELFRERELLTTGRTVLACLDRNGRPQQIPEILKSSGDSGTSG
ncbi:MAG: acyl-CoA thioesterase [Phycisphaerales bacterium]|nr:MAG: acyl-CoA thioesterase [Phycisphaerales bacterium]